MFLDTEKVIFNFSAAHQPARMARPGDTLTIETMDCFANQLREPGDSLDQLDWERINPATGPVYVEGAQPGDTLKITINSIKLNEKGAVVCLAGEGTLGHMLEGSHVRICPVRDGLVNYAPGLQIPIKPMIGVIGVAPAGDAVISTGTPGRHGGNMDNTMIGPGATIYFPVAVAGALFALGDLHAVMGDGEIGVSGLEIPGEVNLTLDVIKGKSREYPIVENADSFAVIVSKQTADEAILRATELALEFLEDNSAFSRPDLIMLMSLTGSVEICQVVDPLKTVRFVLSKKYFPELAF